MKKVNFFNSLLILAVGIIVPQTAFSYCPEQEKTGWSFSDDLLCWKGHEQGIGYANKPSSVLTTTDFTTNKSLSNPKFRYDWGFRLGLGYTECDRQWTYEAVWTSIESKAYGHKTYNSGAPDFLGVFPVWSMSPDTLAGDYVSAASDNWRLHTNLVDLNVQYNYGCWDRLTLMPFLGARGASFNQKLTTKYEGGIFVFGVDENVLRSRYFGAGPRAGLNADYYLTCGFSLFGGLAVAPLFGHFHIKQREIYLEAERFRRNFTTHHMVLSTDYDLGVKWKGIVMDSWPTVLLSLSWDYHVFYNANRFPRGNYGFFKSDRELTLQGLTLSATFDF